MAGIREIEHLWLPLPDGRRLAARLWLPAETAPAPAILEYLPYRKRDATLPRDETSHPVFAEAGFACIRVDIAGSGDSDGWFDDEYSEQELSDGDAVIAWIAEQPWCTGAVGMIGISWGGFNGLQMAARRPPALKAVVSMCATVDRYEDDIHYMGGCLLTDNFNWGAGQMMAYMSRPPDPLLRPDWRETWIRRMESTADLAAEWLRRPLRTAYWKHGSVCEDYAAIEAAVLTIGGWNDAYLNAPFALAENMRAPCAALMGPWEHKYPQLSRILPSDLHGEAIRWFGRWLADDPTGAEATPRLRAYITEAQTPSPLYGPRAGRWVAEPDWPSSGVRATALHLTRTGLSDAPGEGAIAVATPLTVGETAGYFCAGMRIDNELCADQAADDAGSTCFDLELSEDFEVLGRPVAHLAVSVDKPAAQLVLRLCDVGPDGVSQRISYRPFNLTHHAGHDRAEPLEPGRVYRIRIPLNACGHRFAAGRRLRLAVSTSYWPILWPSPEQATVTLHLAECRLTLPRRHVAAEPDPQPPGPARPARPAPLEALSKPRSESRRFTDDAGALVLETFDDFGDARILSHGMETGHSVRQRYAIRPDDPLSARHEAEWRWRFARGDWRTSFETHVVMTCDADTFYLTRRIRAHEGDDLAFEKAWEQAIPRGML